MQREAWIDMPSGEEAMKGRPPGGPYDFGFVPKMGHLLMAHPRLGPPFLQLFGEIMFAPGALTRRERELVAAVTAAGQDCFYRTQSHAEFLRVEGGGNELVEAIKAGDWRSADGLTERERALGELAEKLSTTPTRMVEQDWENLRDLGFDDEACLEVAHIVGIFNHLTRLADGLGLQLDEETSSASQSGIKLEWVEA